MSAMVITKIEVTNLEPSKGDEPTTYEITIKDGAATCSCPAFTFHPTRACKHMRHAAMVLVHA